MPRFEPGWRFALSVAAAALLVAVLVRRRAVLRTALCELAVAMGLWAAWQLIGHVTHPQVVGAEARGRDVYRIERWLHLPSEVPLVRTVADHPWLAHLVDNYYLYGHLNVMVLLLGWTWWKRREAYPAVRLQLVLLSLAGLAMQLVTVAPPRLLPSLGFVDVANTYGESVYGEYGHGLAGQLMAMPSLHVGWAALVAWTLWRLGTGPWRWVGVAHLVVMTLVVVASANHWWLDGIVAVALLAVVVAVVDRLPRRLALPAAVPVPSA